MKFNADKMVFGRHEKFAVRYSWLSKGFQAMTAKGGKDIFESDDATVILGVGKNMVTAIKYWLYACRMICPATNTPTELGKKLLAEDGLDPYLEDEATIWLLHWLLATNAEMATSWYWFFNQYHKADFTGKEVTTALIDFVNNQITDKKKPSPGTLKNDAVLIPRMYTQSGRDNHIPIEENLDSPFSLLKLITQSSSARKYQSLPRSRPDLPLGILGFAVCEMFKMKSTKVIPIEDLIYSNDNYPAIGSIFRITESDLVAKLEELPGYIPDIFAIRSTAGQHQIYLADNINSEIFISQHYKNIPGRSQHEAKKNSINTCYTRSVNLERDRDSLKVTKAYIPTSRALKLFGRVAEGFHHGQAPRSWSLVGPYGSGKSSSSIFLSKLFSSTKSNIFLNIIGAKRGFKSSKEILENCGRKTSVTRSLKALLDKSMITLRRFNREYRVWQGSDFDLEKAIEEELSNMGDFSMVSELNKSNAMMPVVVRRYTIKSGTLRYFISEFIDAQSYKLSPAKKSNPRIMLFLATTKDDEKIFHSRVQQYFSATDVTALCLNGYQLRETTAEVLALHQVQNTRQELNNDPIARREFEDRLAAAEHAQKNLLYHWQEQPQEYTWFNNGKEVSVSNKRDFQEVLSNILKKIYCISPVLHNELINRDRPSSQANAARNKLLEAMLENIQSEDLGIKKFPPEKAIYRSVIRETGLYNPKTGQFKAPGKKSTLYEVWCKIDEFLDACEKNPRSLVELNTTLMAPPYGVKAGVLPILNIAAYIVYQHELALYEQEIYKPVMTKEMLQWFVKRPDQYTFKRNCCSVKNSAT